MKCVELMSTPARTIGQHADTLAAAVLMREHRVGFLPVCDDAGRLVGVVTERDLALRVCAEDEQAHNVPVRRVMTLLPVVLGAGQSVAEARRQMIAHRHAVLPVVDGERRPVGVLSLWDIFARD